jgi:hypothetical protein
MNEATVAQGFTDLGALSQTEYEQSLTEVADGGDPFGTYYRLGRLAGVHLKRPFARCHKLPQRSAKSGARYAWELVSPTEFKATVAPERAVLDEIEATLSPGNPDRGELATYELIERVQHESGVFGLLARVLSPSLCDDPEIASRIRTAFDQHHAETEGPRLGAYLSERIPILDHAGPLVVAAVVSILLTAGPDEFCKNANAWVGVPED